jgi:hypothetical protein
MGLYPTTLLEWNAFDIKIQTWPMLKAHYTEAYNLLLTTGGGTARSAGYHGANATTTEEDDKSMTSITNSIANMHIANNANVQVINSNMSNITAETRELRAMIAQLALMAQGQTTQQQHPAYPAYYQPTQPPQPLLQPPPTQSAYNMTMPPTMATTQQHTGCGGRGGHGRGRRGRGGGRGGRGSRGNYGRGGYGNQYQTPPPQQHLMPTTIAHGGSIPPPPGLRINQQHQTRTNTPNPVKYFNNWNMCCNCGYDVPIWHTSQTCPYKQDYPHHNDSINRTNAKQYKAAGWRVSKKGIHKTQLPTNPHKGQA